MDILWMCLAVVFGAALMARYFAVPVLVSPTSISPNKILAGSAALTLMLVSGLRFNIGDTFFYRHAYEVGDLSWSNLAGQKDVGFYILQILLKEISDDPQILILVTGLITNALIVMVLYRYSRMLEISLYVYITSGAFVVSMNGLRQYLTAAIVFAATPLIVKGDWKKYILVVLFASLFHQSVLVLIPIYFLVRRKAWTRSTAILLLLAIGVVALFNQFSQLLFSSLQDTQYGHYQNFTEGGANIVRVLVYSIPLCIAYLGRERLRELFPQSDVFINMSLMGAILMIISTQNWIFARMAIYFDLYQLVLIGWMIKLFSKKDQKLIYLAILVFYFAFFYYDNVIILKLNYESEYLPW